MVCARAGRRLVAKAKRKLVDEVDTVQRRKCGGGFRPHENKPLGVLERDGTCAFLWCFIAIVLVLYTQNAIDLLAVRL